jgi:hypothetical protein
MEKQEIHLQFLNLQDEHDIYLNSNLECQIKLIEKENMYLDDSDNSNTMCIEKGEVGKIYFDESMEDLCLYLQYHLFCGENSIGSVSVAVRDIMSLKPGFQQWFTLFDDPTDDIYDGDVGSNDVETPKVLLSFKIEESLDDADDQASQEIVQSEMNTIEPLTEIATNELLGKESNNLFDMRYASQEHPGFNDMTFNSNSKLPGIKNNVGDNSGVIIGSINHNSADSNNNLFEMGCGDKSYQQGQHFLNNCQQEKLHRHSKQEQIEMELDSLDKANEKLLAKYKEASMQEEARYSGGGTDANMFTEDNLNTNDLIGSVMNNTLLGQGDYNVTTVDGTEVTGKNNSTPKMYYDKYGKYEKFNDIGAHQSENYNTNGSDCHEYCQPLDVHRQETPQKNPLEASLGNLSLCENLDVECGPGTVSDDESCSKEADEGYGARFLKNNGIKTPSGVPANDGHKRNNSMNTNTNDPFASSRIRIDGIKEKDKILTKNYNEQEGRLSELEQKLLGEIEESKKLRDKKKDLLTQLNKNDKDLELLRLENDRLKIVEENTKLVISDLKNQLATCKNDLSTIHSKYDDLSSKIDNDEYIPSNSASNTRLMNENEDLKNECGNLRHELNSRLEEFLDNSKKKDSHIKELETIRDNLTIDMESLKFDQQKLLNERKNWDQNQLKQQKPSCNSSCSYNQANKDLRKRLDESERLRCVLQDKLLENAEKMEARVLEAEERRKIFDNSLIGNTEAVEDRCNLESMSRENWDLKGKVKVLERDVAFLKDKLKLHEELEGVVKNLESKLKKSKVNEKSLVEELGRQKLMTKSLAEASIDTTDKSNSNFFDAGHPGQRQIQSYAEDKENFLDDSSQNL